MKKVSKYTFKIIIALFVFFAIFNTKNISRATTQEEVGQVIANFASKLVSSYKSHFIYGYTGKLSNGRESMSISTVNARANNAYKGIKTTGRVYGTSVNNGAYKQCDNQFPLDCHRFVNFVVQGATGISAQNQQALQSFTNIGTDVSKIKPGDIIRYSGHYAVAIRKDSGNQYTVVHCVNKASGWSIYKDRVNKDYGGGIIRILRITSSKANIVSVNRLKASLELWDRLDTTKPNIVEAKQLETKNIIKIKATDYKKYYLSSKNDKVEPANYGIKGYTVTDSSTIPTTWVPVSGDKVVEIDKEVNIDNANSSYYVWVLDVGGNWAKSEVKIGEITEKEEAKDGTVNPTTLDNESKPSAQSPVAGSTRKDEMHDLNVVNEWYGEDIGNLTYSNDLPEVVGRKKQSFFDFWKIGWGFIDYGETRSRKSNFHKYNNNTSNSNNTIYNSNWVYSVNYSNISNWNKNNACNYYGKGGT